MPNGKVTALQYGELEVLTGDDCGNISVWYLNPTNRLESGAELLKSFKVHDGTITALQVDATKAVSCGLDGLVNISDIIKGEVLHTLRGHTTPVLAIAFDGKQILSASADGELRYWSWSGAAATDEMKARLPKKYSGPTAHKSLPRTSVVEKETAKKILGALRPSESKGNLMSRLVGRFPVQRR